MEKAISTVSVLTNVGTTDRIVRAVAGTALIAAGLFSATTAAGFIAVLPLIAIPVVLTAMTGYCPLYAAMGISTTRDVAQLKA